MADVLDLDTRSRTVTVQGGMRAPALEGQLAGHGFTLGHYPQSFEYVSLGGCAATRSAGQASTGYGAIEKMVVGLRLAAPADEISAGARAGDRRRPRPASAPGGLRGHPRGAHRGLAAGAPGAERRRLRGDVLLQLRRGRGGPATARGEHQSLPDVVRLSDERETELSLMLAEQGPLKGALTRAYMGARGVAGGCLAILGFEGSEYEVAARRARAKELLRGYGGRPAGSSPGMPGCGGVSPARTCVTTCSARV